MDESELVKQLKNQRENAFNIAIETYSPAMLYTARTMLDSAAAEDVVQDTWLTVISAIEGYEARSGLKTWLCRIAANKAKNWLRKHHRESLVDDFEPLERALANRFSADGSWSTPFAGEAPSSPETITESTVLHECIEKHLALMKQQQATVLMLTEQGTLALGEIADIVGVSAGNVRVLLHRARQRMVLMVEKLRETGNC